MTFFEYMMRYLKKDTPEGDLARDIKDDKKHFPSSDNGKEIFNYLVSQSACHECLDTFVKCYSRYVRYEMKKLLKNREEWQ